MSLTITVLGTPAPQGSKRHVGNGVMVESSAKVKPWREAVKHAALDVLYGLDKGRVNRVNPPPMDGPLAAEMVFTVRKPVSAPKRRRTWPDRMPDLSKLVRATEDALVDAGAIVDDARIVELHTAKRYPGEGEHALGSPGAWIRITEIPDETDLPSAEDVRGILRDRNEETP